MDKLTIEKELLSYLALDDEARRQFKEKRFDASWFHDPIHQKVWEILSEIEEGSVSDALIRSRGGVGWSSIGFTQDIEALLETFRSSAIESQLEWLFGQIALSQQSAQEKLISTAEGLRKIQQKYLESSGRELFLDNLQELMETYLLRKTQHGVTGYPYPWVTMNKLTAGIQKTDLIAIYGHPKAMKSWLWLYIAHHIWWNFKIPIALTSREMTKEVLRERFTAIHGHLDYSKQRSGQFSDVEKHLFKKSIDEIEERQFEVPIYYPVIAQGGEKAVRAVEEEIVATGVKMFFLDAINTLAIKWDEIAQAVLGLKEICKAQKIPLVVTTQGNRTISRGMAVREVDPEQDMGGSLAIVQQCDTLIRSVKIEESQLLISMVGVREAKDTHFILKAVPATFFDELGSPDKIEVSQRPNILSKR